MADASIFARNLPIKYRTFALSQCYTAVLTVRVNDYTILYDSIRRDDRQLFQWRDVDCRALTTTTTDEMLTIERLL